MSLFKKSSLFSALIFMFLSHTAWAARYAVIEAEGADVLAGPSKTFTVLETLKSGNAVTVSNLPLEGYFKVRTAAGTVGWINSNLLKLLEVDEPPPVNRNEAPLLGIAGTPVDPGTGLAVVEDFSIFKAKIFGGLANVGMSDLVKYLSLSGFGTGPQWGWQFHYARSRRLSFFLRNEIIFKGVTIQDSTLTSGGVFTIDTSTIPVFLGTEYTFITHPKFELSVSGALGLGFSSRLQANYLTSTLTDNVTKFSGTAFGWLLKTDGEWRFHDRMGIFIEGGYRYLTTSGQIPTAAGDGAQLFKVAGAYVPLKLDYSGLFGSLGFCFRF